MDNINLIKENANKHISIDNLNGNSMNDHINVRRQHKQIDPFHDEPTLSESASDMGLEFITNDNKKVESENSYGNQPQTDPFMNPNYTQDQYDDNQSCSQFSTSSSIQKLTKKEIRRRKSAALVKLERLAQQGFAPKNLFGIEHSLEELEAEADRCQQMKDIKNGVGFCKTGLIFASKGIELLNSSFNPEQRYMNLNGWSDNILMSVDNYEDMLEEIYIKWSGPMQAWGPEIRLLTALSMNAVGYSMQQKAILQNIKNVRKKYDRSDDILDELEGDESVTDVSSMYSEEYESESNMSEMLEQIPLEPIQYSTKQEPPKKKRGRPPKNKN